MVDPGAESCPHDLDLREPVRWWVATLIALGALGVVTLVVYATAPRAPAPARESAMVRQVCACRDLACADALMKQVLNAPEARGKDIGRAQRELSDIEAMAMCVERLFDKHRRATVPAGP